MITENLQADELNEPRDLNSPENGAPQMNANVESSEDDDDDEDDEEDNLDEDEEDADGEDYEILPSNDSGIAEGDNDTTGRSEDSE